MSEDGSTTAPLPWRVLSSTVTYEDRWLKVRSDHCVTAEGIDVNPYHVVEYPDWVAIVALTCDFRVVLVREYRHGRARIIDGIPGGVIERDDANGVMSNREAGARRELLEETGYGGGRFIEILTAFPDPANQSNEATGFLALDVVQSGARALDASESIEISLEDFPSVLLRLSTGELRMHAMHVAVLWTAAARILIGGADVAAAASLRQQLVAAFA